MEEARPRIAVMLAVGAMALAGCAGAGIDPASAVISPFDGPAVPPGEYRLDDLLSHPLANGSLAILPPELVDLTSDVDGVRLAFVLVRPHTDARVPVIVESSPYYTDSTTPEGVLDEFYYLRYVENFVPHGYAVAFIPVRGTADQGGCIDMHGPKERADLDQAVTWLGEQAWSNGNVGMIGLSYAGATAWEVASLGNPHLKTIVPIAGVNDMHDLLYRNGTTEWRAVQGDYMTGYLRKGTVENNFVAGGYRAPERVAQALVCPEIARAFVASEHEAVLTGDDPLGFWADRDQRPGVEDRYRGSVFVIQGLQDWNVDPGHTYPWINTLEERGIVVKHLLGQWDHRFPDRAEDGPFQDRRLDLSETLLRWFDRWLKDNATATLGPRVEVQDSAHRWRTEDAWPPRDATQFPLYLAPAGKLALSPTSGEERVPLAPAPFKAEPLGTERPQFEAACACATFTSEPFAMEVRAAGLPPVPLTVVPRAPYGHVAAWLYVIEGQDRTLAGWGQIDLRFAAGDGTPREVTPGEPLVARLQLEPLDLVIPAGARLALVVHQGGYSDHAMSLLTAPVELVVGGEASMMRLPTIVRDGSTAFLPPGA